MPSNLKVTRNEIASLVLDGNKNMIRTLEKVFDIVDATGISSPNGEIALVFEGEGDDKGAAFTGGQLTIEDGELIAGKDSFPVPIAFHCTEANTSGKTITGATDITRILQSDTLSATGLFGGTAAGHYVLVGAEAPFEGAKIKYDTMGTVEPDNVCAEFYTDSIGTWTCVDFMATNSAFPYQVNANNISAYDSEQILFGFNPLIRDQESVWEESTFIINGKELTYHWARFLIETAITSDPEAQQIKLHSNRIEFEPFGIFKFGRSRSKISLPFVVVKNNLSTPLNENVSYTPNFDAAYTFNEFAYTATDGIGLRINRPFGLDTSVPIVITLSGYVKGANTGDLYITYEVSQVNDGFIFDGTEPYDSYDLVTTIAAPQNLERFTVKLVANISALQPDADIVVNMVRAGTDPLDTLSANVVLESIAVSGYTWRG